MLWLDRKYILLVSSRLQGFKQKSDKLFNCKCPICGDSEIHKSKRRMYFYVKGNDFRVYCHNCSYNSSVKYFLKQIDLGLYNQYRLDELGNNREQKEFIKTVSPKNDNSNWMQELWKLKKISQLPVGHPARVYVESRNIPTPFHSILRWTSEFMYWTNGLQEKFTKANLALDEGRIIIPYFSRDKKFFAYTGRSLTDSLRYILIVLDHSVPLLFGLDRIDISRKILVVEGPIDSLFLENCLAMSGSNIADLTKIADRDKFVVVFDNEPHKIKAKKKFEQAIQNGFKVCIFPTWVEDKDINQFINNGWKPSYIQELIDENTFSGLSAKIRLEERYK